jgi:hypothetical protein
LQAGCRSKEQSSTHLWLHVTSLAILFPQCYVTFIISILQILSLCFAILSPCLIRTQPVCFFSGPSPCYTTTKKKKKKKKEYEIFSNVVTRVKMPDFICPVFH